MKAIFYSFTTIKLTAFVGLHAMIITVATPCITRAQGIWENGQDATSVLGQTDFVSGSANQGNPDPDATTLSQPHDVAVDPTTGKVFVSDRSNNRVLRYSSVAALQNGAAAEGVLGQPDFTSSDRNLSRSGFYIPRGLWVNASGTLWVADGNHNRVLRFDNASSKANGADADGVLGQPDFESSALAVAQNRIIQPNGVVEDSFGRLWVASENRVLRFDVAASKANGANADRVLGQSGFTSIFPGTTATTMDGPTDVAMGSDGTLWVVDGFNHRVLKFVNAAAKPNGAAADGVLGQASFTTKDTGMGAADLNGPQGIAVDSLGRLWVSDFFNRRILRFDAAVDKENGADADGVLGQPDLMTTGSLPTGPSTMEPPFGLFTDGSTRLWVTDLYNNRVLRFEATVHTSPTIRIKGRKTIRVTRSRHTIRGTATDTNGNLVGTRVKDKRPSGSKRYRSAKGHGNWKYKARLRPGRNVIKAYAHDTTGLRSPIAKVRVIKR